MGAIVQMLIVLMTMFFTISATNSDQESADRAIRGKKNQTLTKQDVIDAIFNDVSIPIFFPKGKKQIFFPIKPAIHYNGLPFSDFYLSNAVEKHHLASLDVKPFKRRPVKQKDEDTLMQLDRNSRFSVFNPAHAQLAAKLTTMLLDTKTKEGFYAMAVYLRDRINLELFVYSLSSATIHHRLFRDVTVPSLHKIFPTKFINEAALNAAMQHYKFQAEAKETRPDKKAGEEALINVEIPVQYTATELEPEQKLAYFREDIGMNLHHWHWHLIFPGFGDIRVVRKDRRGELFYYMHQQLIARYDFERLSNKMPRVKRLHKLCEEILEGYYPKLKGPTGGQEWAGRPSGLTLRDLQGTTIDFDNIMQLDVKDVESFSERILQSIHRGSITLPNGSLLRLDEVRGIDNLTDLVEASILSPNPRFYGSVHVWGHLLISRIHDPDGRYKEASSVMSATETAMRDPIFYRWHSYVNSILREHKELLSPYSSSQLSFSGVRITSFSVSTQTTGDVNTFHTYWEHPTITLDLDFSFKNNINILATITRLQNMPFDYNFRVRNSNTSQFQGVVRIFLLPLLNDEGLRWSINEQKNVAIELDRFTVDLPANREVTFTRSSMDSSVTTPDSYTNEGNVNVDNNCGCGLPQHMLIPKGHEGGLKCQLFAIITNAATERVPLSSSTEPRCKGKSSPAYCGLFGEKYPTTRAMGYPLDRRIRQSTLQDFVQPLANAIATDVTIVFSDEKYVPAPTCRVQNDISSWRILEEENAELIKKLKLANEELEEMKLIAEQAVMKTSDPSE